jgi:hypothetical protein
MDVGAGIWLRGPGHMSVCCPPLHRTAPRLSATTVVVTHDVPQPAYSHTAATSCHKAITQRLPPPAADGSEVPARVIGVDQDKDIAVLQLAQQGGKEDGLGSLSKDVPKALVPLSICTTSTDLQVRAWARLAAAARPSAGLHPLMSCPSVPACTRMQAVLCRSMLRSFSVLMLRPLAPAAGGPARVCHRQPLWPGPHTDHGGGQWHRQGDTVHQWQAYPGGGRPGGSAPVTSCKPLPYVVRHLLP